MGLGFSIVLLAVGAILTFAVHATVAGIDIRVVGVILMAAGALDLFLTLVVLAPRGDRIVTTTQTIDSAPEPVGPQRVTEQEFRGGGV